MFQRYIYLCGKAKKRIPDNDYLVYKREKEYASKDGGNCTSYLKIQ